MLLVSGGNASARCTMHEENQSVPFALTGNFFHGTLLKARAFFVTRASKPALSGTGHRKTNGAITRRKPSCTERGETASLRAGGQEGKPAMHCRAPSRGTSRPANGTSQCQASRSWQLMERQGSSPSTAGAPTREPPGLYGSRQRGIPGQASKASQAACKCHSPYWFSTRSYQLLVHQ